MTFFLLFFSLCDNRALSITYDFTIENLNPQTSDAILIICICHLFTFYFPNDVFELMLIGSGVQLKDHRTCN